MEQTVAIFNFEEIEIRTTIVDGKIWFVAADVCKALGITKVAQAVNGNPTRNEEGLDEDERGYYIVSTLGGPQEMLCVDESGLQELIWKSRKPNAKKFKRWIKREVIPSIASTGVYDPQNQIAKLQQQNLQLIETNGQIMDILVQNLHDQIEGGSAVLNPGNALMQDADLEDWERLYVRLTNLCKDMRGTQKMTSTQFQAVTRLLNEGLHVLKSHLQYLEDHEPLAEAAWNKAYFEVQETQKHQQIIQAQLETLQGALHEVAPALPQKLLN